LYLSSKGESSEKLEWAGRDGKATGVLGEPAQYLGITLSGDGKAAAAEMRDVANGNRDLWIFDTARNLRTRFTFDPGNEMWPVFSSDGRSVIYSSDKKAHLDLYRKAVGGSGGEELLVESKDD